MKKYIFAIIVFILIIFLVTNNKNEESENIQNSYDTENITQNVEIKQENEYSLDGKTIAFIGDSLIEGYGNDYKGIDYYLKEQLPNTNFINNSKSGSTVTDNSGTDNIVMINQAKTLTGDPDIIIFDGGANDIIGYGLGFLNNDLKKEIGIIDTNSSDISPNDSVMNDFEEVILELKNKFPNAKLCYLQPFLLDNATLDHLTNDDSVKTEIQQRFDIFLGEIQKMCLKWDLMFIDTSKKFEGTENQYRQDDWIHINEAGYKVITSEILQKLKNIKES